MRRLPLDVAARTLLLLAAAWPLAAIPGCSGGGGGGREYVTIGTAPIGGAFAPVGNAIASVLEDNKGDADWKVQPQGTKGSQENIRLLDQGKIQLGMSNAAISYYAHQGDKEMGWSKRHDIRAVVTLAPNVGLFITKRESGIRSISDLKGKRVGAGPSGAGFEMFLGPLLTEHGVSYTSKNKDFTPVNENYGDSVPLLGDGNIDAAFMGGAVPVSAVTQACTSYDVYFIPYDEMVRQDLIEKYPFFREAKIPAKNRDGKPTYPGMTEDFIALDVGSMHLITHADQPKELIYKITKTIWENRDEIAQQHPAGRAINEENAVRDTGIPFHEGAIQFYKEIGIWKENGEE